MSSPLITRPTIRPRWSGSARCAANGTRICATTEVSPTSTETAANTAKVGASAAASSAAAVPTSTRVTSFLFSTRSPIGSTNSRPAA